MNKLKKLHGDINEVSWSVFFFTIFGCIELATENLTEFTFMLLFFYVKKTSNILLGRPIKPNDKEFGDYCKGNCFFLLYAQFNMKKSCLNKLFFAQKHR